MNVKEIEIKEFNEEEKNVYESFFYESPDVSLTQDWEYGTLVSNIKKWKCKRFKIVYNKDIIAVYQAFEKKILLIPFIKIVYINRGPVLNRNLEQNDVFKLYKILRNKYSILKGFLLLINPLLLVNNENNLLFKKTGFFSFKNKFYLTSFIDLLTDERILRAQLKSKWRNQLVGAEKKEIRVTLDTSGEFDDFLKKKYFEMLVKKKIHGLSKEFIEILFFEFRKLGRVHVFYAFSDDNTPIAFTCSVTYGAQAIYLIGWVADEYRNLNPSNLLIWKTILYLKQNMVKVFDLGGMDPALSGINKFKNGTGAIEVKYYHTWILLN